MPLFDLNDPKVREAIITAAIDRLAANYEEETRRWLAFNSFERRPPFSLPLAYDPEWPEVVYEDLLDAEEVIDCASWVSDRSRVSVRKVWQREL